jgi:hypothetical protein
MKIKIPLQIIELEEGNFHIIATGIFDDGTSGFWAIDTGASKTVFDKNLNGKYEVSDEEADEIHTAGVGEKPLSTTLGKLPGIRLGKLQTDNMKVALLDLSHINKLYKKATEIEICGLIGGDFLMKYHAVIDYKRKVLILNK